MLFEQFEWTTQPWIFPSYYFPESRVKIEPRKGMKKKKDNTRIPFMATRDSIERAGQAGSWAQKNTRHT